MIPDAKVGGVNFLYVKIILQDGVAVISVSPGCVFPRTYNPREECFPTGGQRSSQSFQGWMFPWFLLAALHQSS